MGVARLVHSIGSRSTSGFIISPEVPISQILIEHGVSRVSAPGEVPTFIIFYTLVTRMEDASGAEPGHFDNT